MTAVIRCQAIKKSYDKNTSAKPILRGIDLQINAGDTCILLGPSGSGKTTLLSILGCLLTPDSGSLELVNRQVNVMQPEERSLLRQKALGFIFQHAQLLPFLTIRQNVTLVAQNSGLSILDAKQRTSELLQRLGIEEFADKKPGLLSGGQRQRVAISRALVHKPAIILADEPTASLDWTISQTAITLLIEQTCQLNATLIVVSHDHRLIPQFKRVFHIDNGVVMEKTP